MFLRVASVVTVLLVGLAVGPMIDSSGQALAQYYPPPPVQPYPAQPYPPQSTLPQSTLPPPQDPYGRHSTDGGGHRPS